MKQLAILLDTNLRVLELYRDKERTYLDEIRYLNSTLGNLIPRNKEQNKSTVDLFREDLFRLRINMLLVKKDIRKLKESL